MPAHLRALRRCCQYKGCEKGATVELVTQHGDALGVYCPDHGRVKLAEQEKRENRTMLDQLIRLGRSQRLRAIF